MSVFYYFMLQAQWSFWAARWGKNKTQARMKANKDAVAEKRLRARPPFSMGLSKKSPKTAPNGLVKMKAAQKRIVREIRVQK